MVSDNARHRAAEILIRWEKQGLPLDLLLSEELAKSFSDPRDYQFCRALVYGVVRWRGYLDAVLARYSRHPPEKMKPLTRQALRCGLFQLVGMDRVPPSAAINETVNLLKSAGQPRWLTGFANALLRRINRELENLPRPGSSADQFPAWPRHELLSYPHWLYQRWSSRYGVELTEAICRAGNEEAGLTLRVGRRCSREDLMNRLRDHGAGVEIGKYAPAALCLQGYRGKVEDLPGYSEGFFQVQDEAAQLVTLIMGDPGDDDYLDACAGLGGKTTHLAELAGGKGRIMAVEPEPRRLALLGSNLQRLGLQDRVDTFAGTLAQMLEKSDRKFRGILVDAPCSGLGVIRRHPDIRWNRGEADLSRVHKRQLELLEEAAGLLGTGGVMVYATCSTEPEENEQVVEAFLVRHDEFELENCRDFLPGAAHELVDRAGFFRSRPDQGLDGFFSARLKKIIKN